VKPFTASNNPRSVLVLIQLPSTVSDRHDQVFHVSDPSVA
jgi:hypothetical protein